MKGHRQLCASALLLGGCLGQSAPPAVPAGEPGPPDAAPAPSPIPTPLPTGAVAAVAFPPGAAWSQDVSGAALDPESATMIADLAAAGGWGTGRMQIDFSITVLRDDGSTPLRSFAPTGDFYSPDCDHVPLPVPAWGRLEGETGLSCAGDGDCHLIVTRGGRLYEMWRANLSGTTFEGGCLVVWDLAQVYPPTGRGDQCTSADAAGYPIAPLLFTADEVAAGSIGHAIRFILPNDRIRRGAFVHPATHSTSTSGTGRAVLYGAHLRLEAGYDLTSLPAGARVVARAMQRYGLYLADGGNVALTAESDAFSLAKWDGLLGPHDLAALKVTDFEVVAGGARIPYTGDCSR